MNKRHIALVIGNAAYAEVSPLENPTNDADDIAAILAKRDFTVIKKTDCTHKEMDLALNVQDSDQYRTRIELPRAIVVGPS